MTKEEFQIALFQRRNRRKMWNSREVAELLSITHASLVNKIGRIKDDQFRQEHFVGRAYHDEGNHRNVYYDIDTAGVMLLSLKQQSDEFRVLLIDKLLSFL